MYLIWSSHTQSVFLWQSSNRNTLTDDKIDCVLEKDNSDENFK